jgi:hypothetical protein
LTPGVAKFPDQNKIYWKGVHIYIKTGMHLGPQMLAKLIDKIMKDYKINGCAEKRAV